MQIAKYTHKLKLIFLSLTLCLPFFSLKAEFAGQQDRHAEVIIEDIRPLNNISQIKADGSLKLNVTISPHDAGSLRLIGRQSDIEHAQITMDNGVLSIVKENYNSPDFFQGLTVHSEGSTQTIGNFEISGKGNVISFTNRGNIDISNTPDRSVVIIDGKVVAESDCEKISFKNGQLTVGDRIINLTNNQHVKHITRGTIEAYINLPTLETVELVCKSRAAVNFNSESIANFKLKLRSGAQASLNNAVIAQLDIEQSAGSNAQAHTVSEHINLNSEEGSVINLTGSLSKSLTISASSGAQVNAKDMNINAESITVNASNGSSVALSGNVMNLRADISSASNLAAGELKAQAANVDISSAGSAKVNAISELNVNCSAASRLSYADNPQLKKDISSNSLCSIRTF